MPSKTDIKVGDIYRDCSYHPVICESIEDDDITGVSLIDGSRPRSCFIRHCGVHKISQDMADKLVAAWNQDGERGIMRVAGWTDEHIDDFMAKWR